MSSTKDEATAREIVATELADYRATGAVCGVELPAGLVGDDTAAMVLGDNVFHGQGFATLLGDAAHNTTPDIGQGGCSAMEDAVALQFSLRDHPDDVYAALAEYQAARAERAGDLVLRARKRCDVTHAKDPEKTAQWYSELREEDGTNIIRGIVGNIVGGPLTS